MKPQFFMIIMVSLFIASCGNVKISSSDKIVDYPDTEAQFPGGGEGMKKFLAKNIRYPEVSMVNGEQGKVYVQFVIEKDGSLSQIEVLRGVSKAIDKETIRVISTMPKWTPAIYKRKYVRARARIPINYVLN